MRAELRRAWIGRATFKSATMSDKNSTQRTWGGRFETSPDRLMAQINASNVSGLRVAWSRSEGFGESTWESF